MKTETLSVDLLRTDAGTQCRVSINEETVDDYAELIANSNGEWPLGNIIVFHDGTEYVVADGFHRTLAAHRTKRGSVPCVVHKGTATDARIFGMTANDRHGLRMTRADKRSCVEWLLDHEPKRTQTEISDLAGVSRRTVASIVSDRKPKIVQTSQTSGWVKPPKTKPAPKSDSPPTVDAPTEPTEPAGEPCPNCGGTEWTEDTSGVACSACSHPQGEPLGDLDPGEPEWKTLQKKTVNTINALMRAFDDLHAAKKNKPQWEVSVNKTDSHCKTLLTIAKEW